tara:strand:+ start:726 stop:854 length:129 start_codon:yes stop_codon:yes gene_type:complete
MTREEIIGIGKYRIRATMLSIILKKLSSALILVADSNKEINL